MAKKKREVEESEIISHLKGDIKGYKKEEKEDRGLIKRLKREKKESNGKKSKKKKKK